MKRYDSLDILEFVISVFKSAGVRKDVAEHTAKGLVQTSIRGIDSHGIRLIPHYIRSVKGGRINPDPEYKFEKTSYSTGKFDADHTFGHAAGIEAMRKAMALAEEAGTGHTSVYNSTHCGALAYFSLEAAKNGFIGISYTHANSLMNTPGSIRPFFGINPICIAVPCEGETPFCFDSAPTAITWNKLLQLREDNEKCSPLSGVDSEGHETDDPNKATQLMAIGGYKGFGLAMMVDIFCGLLTGMPVGREISNMYEAPLDEKRYLGQFYSVIRIDAFQEAEFFKRRMKDLMDAIRNEPRADSEKPIMVPGDPEKKTMDDRMKNGIPVKEMDVEAFEAIAKEYGLSFPGERKK